MADPIEVNYTPDGDDWTVTVKGRGQTLTGRASGLIAARDHADQLVEKIAPEDSGPGHRTVVHLLDGDAVDFTTAYLTARMAKTEPAKPLEVPAPMQAPEHTDKAEQAEPATPAVPKPAPPKPAPPKPTPPPAPKVKPEEETARAETAQEETAQPEETAQKQEPATSGA